MKKIKIKFAGNTIMAQLNDTDTSKEIISNLPLRGIINRWGDEIYFSIPVEGELEHEEVELEAGSLGFWPPGNAFCIFFGPTPMSIDETPRAAGPVTVIGKILDKSDFKTLRRSLDGQDITIV